MGKINIPGVFLANSSDSVGGHDTSAIVYDAAAVGDGTTATGHVGDDCSNSNSDCHDGEVTSRH